MEVGFQRKFRDDFLMTYRQEVSKLMDRVDVDYEQEGSVIYFDYIGEAAVRQRRRVGEKTQHNPPPLSRRLIRPQAFKWDAYLSDNEVRKLGRSPQSKYMTAAVQAHYKNFDITVVAAAFGTAYSVDSDLAETGVALPSAQKIAAASSGLTLAKINRATSMMDKANVPQTDRYATIGPSQKENLLSLVQATSSDYVSKKLLDSPNIDELDWAGWRWRLSTILPLDSSGDRSCLFHQKMAIGVWMPETVRTEAAKDPGASFDTAMLVEMEFGGVRVQEAGVIQVACKES